MTNHTTDTQNTTSVLAPNTTIQYHGSMHEFHGLYGWTERSYPYMGQTRYDIALSAGPGHPVERLSLVRRQSITPGPNPG